MIAAARHGRPAVPRRGAWLVVCACAALSACGATAPAAKSSAAAAASASPIPVPGGSSTASAAAGCVDKKAATDIWTRINNRLNAIALDPKHAGLSDVTTGTAEADLSQYIQGMLVAKNLTEREVDTLDGIAVTDGACTGGNLVLTVDTTVARDDYLKPDGTVDHVDPSVGSHLHLLETFTRVNGTWKESDISDANGPSPTSGIV